MILYQILGDKAINAGQKEENCSGYTKIFFGFCHIFSSTSGKKVIKYLYETEYLGPAYQDEEGTGCIRLETWSFMEVKASAA
jgi:hypothetical protein